MGIPEILIFFLITLASCSPNSNSGSQGRISESFESNSTIKDKGKWIDISEIKQCNGFYLSSKNIIYGLEIETDSSFPIERYLESLTPVPYANVNTFMVCINDDREPYAKDDKRVYYAYSNDILFEDGEDMSAEVYIGDLSINGADPLTFKYIGQGYAIDKNNMYYQGRKIKWNDHILSALQQHDCPD